LRTRFFRSVNTNRYIGYNTAIRRIGVFGQGVFDNACKRRRWYAETFNNIRNMIFSNYLETKTGPIELSKRHIHSNFNTTISAMLCYIRWVMSRNVSCLFPREQWGYVFQNVICSLRIHFENSTAKRYTSNCFLM
jgi:hypothetical protein